MTAGSWLTLTVTLPDAVLYPSNTSTVYTVVTRGLTTGFASEDVKPGGLEVQLKVWYVLDPPPGIALISVDSLRQMMGSRATGFACRGPPSIVTTVIPVDTQPLLSVTSKVKFWDE